MASAAAKKTFATLMKSFNATPRWTLRHFKQNLQEGARPRGQAWDAALSSAAPRGGAAALRRPLFSEAAAMSPSGLRDR